MPKTRATKSNPIKPRKQSKRVAGDVPTVETQYEEALLYNKDGVIDLHAIGKLVHFDKTSNEYQLRNKNGEKSTGCQTESNPEIKTEGTQTTEEPTQIRTVSSEEPQQPHQQQEGHHHVDIEEAEMLEVGPDLPEDLNHGRFVATNVIQIFPLYTLSDKVLVIEPCGCAYIR